MSRAPPPSYNPRLLLTPSPRSGLIYSNNNRWANEAVAEIKTLPLNPDGVYPETGTTESWSTIPLSADITPRGESASGTWYDSADSPNLIIMGGLSITGSSITAHSDTYSFHLPTRTFTALTIANSASNRPTPRFSHAGTVVGDMFVVHGGRSMQEGRERWFMLEDCWALDLRTQEWTELTDLANGPSISRSYHAMVTAANNKDFYAFGGYRTVSSKGTQVAYVFSDLFSNTVVTSEEVDESTSSNVRDEERVLPRVKEWLKFSPTNGTLNGVDVRFQHVAVVYENTMILHGGRFQDTNDVTEMWAINISNIPSKAMVLATEDGLDDGYVALKTLHLVVAVMLMVVLLFIALFGVLRRRIVMEGGHGDGAALFRGVNAGLDQNFIDTIPVVKYRKKAGGDSAESSAAHGATIAVNDDDANSVHSEDDEDVCPICLCSLDEGSDVNVLPCDHVFHPECVGTWLKRNATCPACRQSLRTLMAGGRGRREGRGGGTGGRAVEIEMSVISSTRREEAETNI